LNFSGSLSRGGFGGGAGRINSVGGFGGGDTPSVNDGGAGGGAGLGGALFNDTGTVSLTNCTFTSNSALGGVAPVSDDRGMGFGGAVFNLNGTMQLTNCTLASNTVTNGDSSTGAGGGIYNLAHEVSEGVGVANPASVTLLNTILYGSSGGASDLVSDQRTGAGAATVTATAPNIVGQFATVGGGTINSSGISTANPLLGGLTSNGGPTQTMSLQVGSPAIDAGNDSGVPSPDQRGQARLVGAHVDLGAFEDQIVVTAASNQQAAQGVATSLNVGAFSDQMTGISSWSVSVNWGDNSSNEAFTANSQGALPTHSHTYASLGLFTVTLTVSDSDGNVNTASFQVNVTDAPLTAGTLTSPVATEGQAISNQVLLHFTDADVNGTASDYKATVTWGDGAVEDSVNNPSTVQVVAHSGGGFDVLGSHIYSEEVSGGTFTVQVRDTGGASAISASNTTFSVADATLTAGNLTPPANAVAGTPISNQVLFHFSDTDPNAAATDYTATVTWGDGAVEDSGNNPTDVQVVAHTGGGFDVVGSHTYLAGAPGGLTFAVAVADHGASPVSASTTITVSGDAVINGTTGDDTLLLSRATGGPIGSVTYTLNGGTPVTLTSLTSFTFNGGAGNDTMIVSLGNGRPLLPGFVHFDGGTGNNTLVVNAASTGVNGVLLTQLGRILADGQAIIDASVQSTNLDNSVAVNTGAGADTADRATALAGLSASERFVQALYLDVLGRAGAKAELDGWLGTLQAGGQQAVAAGIEGTFEARDRLVQTWYRVYLGRTPAGGEERGWVNLLLAGQSEEQTLGQILGAVGGEFYQRAQTLIPQGSADQRFVQALYQVLLGRSAGSAELAGWLAALPGLGRAGVPQALLQSAEARNDVFEGYYEALLHRPSSGTDQPFLSNVIGSSVDDHSVRLLFESSAEFFSNG
jgi:hypothetical protein